MEKSKTTKFPMRLQFFAEDPGNGNGKEPAPQPTVEELMEQLAAERAEKERFKAANDKLSKSEAEMKRRERARMTTEEQEAEARREAEEAQKKAYEDAIAELNLMKAVQAYGGTLTDDKNVSNIISAVDEKDHKGIALIIKSEIDKAVKTAKMEWLKNRPQPSVGVGGVQMSKEDIYKITDDEQRIKAIAQNLAAFN